MNDTHESDHRQEIIQKDPGKPQSKSKGFRLGKVLMVVVPLVVLAIAAVAVVPFIDLDTLLENMTRPALAPATGQVFYHGEPLNAGQVVTEPVAGRGRPALGWTDEEGRFSLKTDIQGKFVDGATVGEHRVAVTLYGTSPGPSQPPLLTPKEYSAVDSTPLRISVARDSQKNDFKLLLEGDPPKRPERPAQGKGKATEAEEADDAPKDQKAEDTPTEQ